MNKALAYRILNTTIASTIAFYLDRFDKRKENPDGKTKYPTNFEEFVVMSTEASERVTAEEEFKKACACCYRDISDLVQDYLVGIKKYEENNEAKQPLQIKIDHQIDG